MHGGELPVVGGGSRARRAREELCRSRGLVQGEGRRLHGPVLRGTAGGGGRPRRGPCPLDALPRRQARRRGGHRRECRRRADRAAALPDGPAILRAPAAHRARELGRHRPRELPRLRRGRRLRGAGEGALRDDARGGRAGGHRERPARARWRWLPDGPQVVDGRQDVRRAEVRRLQRRRGRPGRVHGPGGARVRPAPGARGHGDRRVRDRREQGLRLRARRVPAGGRAARHRDPQGEALRLPRQQGGGDAIRLRSRDTPRRGRVRLRRGDRADGLDRGPARPAATAAALSGGVRTVGPSDADQQRRDVRQHRADRAQRRRVVRLDRHAESRRARRCSRSPARSRTPA